MPVLGMAQLALLGMTIQYLVSTAGSPRQEAGGPPSGDLGRASRCRIGKERPVRQVRGRLSSWFACASLLGGIVFGDERAAAGVGLVDPDSQVRLRAVIMFGCSTREGTAQFLVQAVSDKDPRVRCWAAYFLGQHRDEGCIAALATALGDEDPGVRLCAAKALASMGEIAVAVAVKAVHNDDSNARESAVLTLGWLGTKVAIRELVAALGDRHPAVRSMAAFALGQCHGEERALSGLVVALTDPNARVRANAARALGGIGDKRQTELVLRALQDRSASVREAAIAALGSFGDRRAVDSVVRMLKNKEARVRRAAALSLGRLGDRRATEPLLVLLRDADRDVRVLGAQALGRLRDRRALEPLMAMLNSKEVEDRRTAAFGLGELRDVSTTISLVAVLGDKDHELRLLAARALGGLGNREAVLPLTSAMRDEMPDVREAAAKALGDLGDKRALPSLLEGAKDGDSGVRSAVAYALGKLGDNSAIPALLRSLTDWHCGPYVCKALDALHWRPIEQREYVYYLVGKRDSQELLAHWKATKGILLKDLRDSEKGQCQNAVYALVGIGRGEVIDDLSAVLRTKGNREISLLYFWSGNSSLRAAAASWAEKYWDPVALAETVYFPPVRWGKLFRPEPESLGK